MDCSYCNDDLEVSIRVAHIKTTCKYHKRIDQVFSPGQLAPDGLCRTLFYSAYPSALASLYHGKPRRFWFRRKGQHQTVVGCPAPNGVRAKVTAKDVLPAPLRMLKELAEEALKLILRGYDAPYRKVELELLEVGADCPKGYRPGEKFRFNIDDSEELCPAAFSNVFPYFNFLSNARQAGSTACSMKVHCPDHVGVVFDVKVE